MYCWTLCPANGHAAVLGIELSHPWVGSTQVGGYSLGITDTPLGTWRSRVIRLLAFINYRMLRRE
jgi:hypothetical protein